MTFKDSLLLFNACLILNCSGPVLLHAQHYCNMTLTDRLPEDRELLRLMGTPDEFESEIECRSWMNHQIAEVHALGYIEAGYEGLLIEKDTTFVRLFIGRKWHFGTFRRGNIPVAVFNALGLDRGGQSNVANVAYVADAMESIVRWYENHGWPFVSVKLDSIAYEGQLISADFNVERGPYCSIDSILIVGDASISSVYLYHYLGFRPGSEYNESIIRELDARLEELPFVRRKQNSEVIFTEKATKVKLFLEKKSSSYIDGVAGVQPEKEGAGVRVTGDLRFKLVNALHRGEQIGINWRKLQQQTFSFVAKTDIPYVFSLPFGLGGGIDIYRKDTTYATVKRTGQISYLLRRGASVSLSYQFDQSSLVSTAGLSSISALPDIVDFKFNGYGLSASFIRLDYRLNPRRGWELSAGANAGTKQILKNPGLPEMLYDSTRLRTSRYSGHWAGAFYVPVGKRSTIRTGTKCAYLYSEQLFTNELYRIGGMHYFRGFEEESILANAYAILSIEYRYLLEKNSFAHVFWDGAYYENIVADPHVYGTPFGFGAGISVGTKAGIFRLSYAFGQHLTNLFTNNLSLRSGRLHFGFFAQF